MKIPYNADLMPPAPFLTVRVSNLLERPEPIALPALLDTGADLTAIPVSLVAQLGLSPAGELAVEGYDGRSLNLISYDITLHVAHVHLVGLQVVPFSESYVLLGRDALNLLRLLLDGPDLSLQVLDQSLT